MIVQSHLHASAVVNPLNSISLTDTWNVSEDTALQPTSIQKMQEIYTTFKPLEKTYSSEIEPLNDLCENATHDQKSRLSQLNIHTVKDTDLLWETVIRIATVMLLLSHACEMQSQIIPMAQNMMDGYVFLAGSDKLTKHGRQDIERKIRVLSEVINALQVHIPTNQHRIDEIQVCAAAQNLIGAKDCAKVAQTAQKVLEIYKDRSEEV